MPRLVLELEILLRSILPPHFFLPSNGQCITSGSYDNTTHVLDTFSYTFVLPSSCNSMHPGFCAKPDLLGKTQTVAYSTGCPKTVVPACIHMLS